MEVVAGADVSAEARDRFASEAGIEPRHTYAAFEDLLQRERPDVVSICTWPPLHPELTEAAAGAGVKAVLTEKPMAVDLPGCDRMLAACEGAGALLVVGHQRRLTPKFSRARALIDEGAIGTPLQLTGIAGGDLLTDGTHTVDALRFFAADAPVRWVIGNIDPRPRVLPPLQPGDPPRRSGFQEWDEKGTRYGHPVEQGAFALLAFDGDLRATLETGVCARPGYQRFRIDGSEGAIALSGDRPAEGEARLRVRRRGSAGWEVLDEELPDLDGFTQEITLLLDALDHGTPHPLAGRSARADARGADGHLRVLPPPGPGRPPPALTARRPARRPAGRPPPGAPRGATVEGRPAGPGGRNPARTGPFPPLEDRPIPPLTPVTPFTPAAPGSPLVPLARGELAAVLRPGEARGRLDALLAELNAPQRAAATRPDGPLLVVAGPGAGKTRVIAARVAYLLLGRGVPPGEVAAITFSRRAAGELEGRLAALAGSRRGPRAGGAPEQTGPPGPAEGGVWAGTFHALGARILRRGGAAQFERPPGLHHLRRRGHRAHPAPHPGRPGRPGQPRLPPGPRGGTGHLPRQAPAPRGRGHPRGHHPDHGDDRRGGGRAPPGGGAHPLRRRPAARRPPSTSTTWWASPPWPSTATPPCAPGPGPGRGTSWWTSTRTPTPPRKPCCAAWPPRPTLPDLCVVADPQQSIYAFRGAAPEQVRRFLAAWPGAAVARLEQNYRSTRSIVAVARRLVAPRRRPRRQTAAGGGAPQTRLFALRLWTENPAGTPARLWVAPHPEQEAGAIARDVRALLDGTADEPGAAPARRRPALEIQGDDAPPLNPGPRRTSPSSSAPTPRPAPSRPPSCGPGSPTPSSAGCASSPGRRSRTPWPTCAWPSCGRTPPRSGASSTPPAADWAPRRS